MNKLSRKLLIETYALGKENNLIEAYIVAGPSALRKTLGVNKKEWKVIFDYLIFENKLLNKCVETNLDFFVDLFAKFGMAHVRAIFEIESSKYDHVVKEVFDLVAIDNEGLYLNVLQNRKKYLLAFKARGGEYLRVILGIVEEKYDECYGKILDVLLNAACDGLFSERNLDHGLKNFSMMMNSLREHRPLCKYNFGEK